MLKKRNTSEVQNGDGSILSSARKEGISFSWYLNEGKRSSNHLLPRRGSTMRSLIKEEGGLSFRGQSRNSIPNRLWFVPKVGLSNHLETQLELQKQDKVCCRISSYNRESTTKAKGRIQLNLYSLNILQRQVYE